MNILGFNKFLEDKLNLTELDKSSGDGKRGDVLIRKILNAEDITLVNNKNIKIDKMKDVDGTWQSASQSIVNIANPASDPKKQWEYDPQKAKGYFTGPGTRYKPVLKSGSDEIKLNSLKKTKEFGSRGAGVRTRQNESVQCILLAFMQDNPGVVLDNKEESTNNIFSRFNEYIQRPTLPVKLPKNIELSEELLTAFESEPDWILTFCDVPNKIYSEGRLSRRIRYTFYHASYVGEDSPAKIIENKFKKLGREAKKKFHFVDFSKFCPADVYALQDGKLDVIKKEINEVADINKLTEKLNELFNLGILRPISLKMITSKYYRIIDNSESTKLMPEFYLYKFHFGSDLRGIFSKISTTAVWKSRDGNQVESISRKMNFDSSDTSKNQNIDGEVDGSSSKHGKINYREIKNIIENYKDPSFKFNLEGFSDLKNRGLDELIDKFWKLLESIKTEKAEVESKSITTIPLNPYDHEIADALPLLPNDIVEIREITKGKDISKNENKLISRIQSMQLVLLILQIWKSNQAVGNLIMTKIMRYALSIETDYFVSPKYIRVL
jgi:hypothetical protein